MNPCLARLFLCVGVLISVCGCNQETEVVDSTAELTALAILAHSYGSPAEPFLLASTFETGLSPNDSAQESREILLQGLNTDMGLEESTVDAFLEVNTNVGKLDFELPTRLNAQMISQESFEQYFSDNEDLQVGWNALFNDHNGPIAVYWVSRIGMNDEANQALIWVRHAYGPLATSGNFYMLTRLDRHWSVTELPIPHLIGQTGRTRQWWQQATATSRLTLSTSTFNSDSEWRSQ